MFSMVSHPQEDAQQGTEAGCAVAIQEIMDDSPLGLEKMKDSSSYDCPICLGSYDLVHSCAEADLRLMTEDSSSSSSISCRIPILFEESHTLDVCKHRMCRSCLSMYCESKIREGIVDIRCCVPLLDHTNNMHDTSPPLLAATTSESDQDPQLMKVNKKTRTMMLCNTLFTHHDVEQILLTNHSTFSKEDIYRKYERFEFEAIHGDACRRCPQCDRARIFSFPTPDTLNSSTLQEEALQQQNPFSFNIDSYSAATDVPQEEIRDVSSTAIEPQQVPMQQKRPTPHIVNCHECDTEFCYFHSNAHTGRTCEEYEEQQRVVDEKSAEYLREHSKCCPKCGMNVQKMDGCNQMQCPKCQTHFCWLCLAIIGNDMFPAHFQWWNLAGCPNLQLHEGTTLSSRAMCFSRVVSFLQIIFIGIPSVILMVVTVILFPCCFMGKNGLVDQRMQDCISLWGNVLTGFLLTPVMLAVTLMSCIVFILKGVAQALLVLFQELKKILMKANGKVAECRIKKHPAHLEERVDVMVSSISSPVTDGMNALPSNHDLSLDCNKLEEILDVDVEKGCSEETKSHPKKPRVDDTVAITVLDSFTENDPQSKVCNSLITSQKNVNIEACDIVCSVIGEEYC